MALWRQEGVLVSIPGMRSGRDGPRRSWRAALVLAALAVAAGCSEKGGSGATTTAPPTSSTVATSTSGGADPVAAEIVGRYKRYWEVRFEANQPPPNPDLPALREYATGQQLDQVVAETRRHLADTVAVRRPANSVGRSSVRLVKLDGDFAVLQECVVDDDIVYRYTTGEVVDATVATHSVEGTMRMVDGSWKLAAARRIQRWEGVAGCALSSDF